MLLSRIARFDVILDGVGGDTEEWAVGLLKPWSGAKYVTLVTPLLFKTDSLGLVDGLVDAGSNLGTKVIQVAFSDHKKKTESKLLTEAKRLPPNPDMKLCWTDGDLDLS